MLGVSWSARAFTSCGGASLLLGTRDLPGPGIGPMYPALHGTTGPPGKSEPCLFITQICLGLTPTVEPANRPHFLLPPAVGRLEPDRLPGTSKFMGLPLSARPSLWSPSHFALGLIFLNSLNPILYVLSSPATLNLLRSQPGWKEKEEKRCKSEVPNSLPYTHSSTRKLS